MTLTFDLLTTNGITSFTCYRQHELSLSIGKMQNVYCCSSIAFYVLSFPFITHTHVTYC